jgi:hypothetical protein
VTRARLLLAVVALVAAALGPTSGPVSAAAATPPGLTLVGDATYDVRPDEGRVQVTVVLTATNNLVDTKTKKFYFRVGYLTVLPNTQNFKLTAASGKPKVTISSATDTYTNLKLDFGANLASGKSATLTLTYDIQDPGGAPDRAVRISTSLVSFGVWAVAAPGSTGGSVTVRFPSGYDVLVRRGPLAGPTPDADGHDVWTSGTLSAPLDFVADVSADRPTDYAESQRTVRLENGTATLTLQAWPDDPAWEARIGSLVERALPVLEQEIGLAWPSDQPLQVREALIRSTGGYAGIYDPSEHRIDVAYAAPDAVVIHELAHAWFNGGLVADRWIAEGFASHYANLAAQQLGIDPVPVAPPDPGAPAQPLNGWGPPSPDASSSEAWGYTASLDLADEIAARAGEETLRTVWARAASGVAAYLPTNGGGAEQASGPPDWRGFLDLLEEASGRDFTDLWRLWVARPQDLDVLADRAAARGFYVRSVALARDWQLPASIRAAMRAWRFDVAREQLLAADAVQAQRTELEKTAAAAGATLPGTLRGTFEGDAGLAAAAAEASAEQAVVDAIAAARATRPTEQGVGERAIISVGLLFEDPDARLSGAVHDLAAGSLQPAYQDAVAAEDAWRNAADAGRSRILSVILLGLATVLLIGLVRRGLMPPSPGVTVRARRAGGRQGDTLAGHPAGTVGHSAGSADDEGGAATQG